MIDRTVETSPQFYARIGGWLYLLIIVAGMFGEIFVRNKLIVSGDVTATANNIIAAPSLWRLGITGDLIMHVCDVPVMLVIYVLLRPVNSFLALLALLFNLIQTAVLVANKLNLLTTLFLLGDANYRSAFGPHQLDALSYLPLKLHDYGFGVGLIFFGFVCLIEGYLIFKSGYLPKTIGALMQIAGLCYLTNSFALLLDPALASALFPAIMVPALIAETSFCLWLIVMGVNVPKWEERVRLGRLRGRSI
jgi:uncharacterized protein DUF4386